ncbi:hypothetical protein C8J57DRAFT_1707343 [Mycena rebaudengoi]|nr:hypothetical protein C8J57DRAFT_1707343 [Mycena rebaudengoi]
MSDSRLYSRLLLPKGHGYPLFHPQPFDDLPEEARRIGTEIGDVGVMTSDGSFDVVFNICRRADDPINRFGVPEGFEQVRLVPGDVAPRASYHRPGSDVSNTKISKRRLDVDAGVDGNVSAAVLLLPDGASRSDLRRLKKFRNYALKHAQRWYAFVNGELERMVESNALYLVTGVDKCSTWSVAAVENQSEDCRVSLKLKAALVGSAGTTCAWEWETASSFADSGPRRLPGEELWKDNQTVFLRGFKVAIRAVPLQRFPKALSVVDSKPSKILSKSGFIPYSRSSSGGTNSFSRSPTQPNDLSNSDDSEDIEYFPNSLTEFHPAHAINAYLLDSCPDAMVAVTHDDEWASVLNEDDDEVPEETELIKRVLNKYKISFAQGGIHLMKFGETSLVFKFVSLADSIFPNRTVAAALGISILALAILYIIHHIWSICPSLASLLVGFMKEKAKVSYDTAEAGELPGETSLVFTSLSDSVLLNRTVAAALILTLVILWMINSFWPMRLTSLLVGLMRETEQLYFDAVEAGELHCDDHTEEKLLSLHKKVSEMREASLRSSSSIWEELGDFFRGRSITLLQCASEIREFQTYLKIRMETDRMRTLAMRSSTDPELGMSLRRRHNL